MNITKLITKFNLVILNAILFICWLILISSQIIIFVPVYRVIISILFTLIGVIIAELFIIFAFNKKNSNTPIENISPILILAEAFVISILISNFFHIKFWFTRTSILIIVNIILITIYTLLISGAYSYTVNLSNSIKNISNSINTKASLKDNLQFIILNTKHEEFKNRLNKILTDIKFSDNMSRNNSNKYIDEFKLELKQLETLLSDNINDENEKLVSEKISNLEKLNTMINISNRR